LDALRGVVPANRHRAPILPIIAAKFALRELDLGVKEAAKRTVLPAAIVP
jgi:hypothetical protein